MGGAQQGKRQTFASEVFTHLSFMQSQPRITTPQQPDVQVSGVATVAAAAAQAESVSRSTGIPVAAGAAGDLIGAVAFSCSVGEIMVSWPWGSYSNPAALAMLSTPSQQVALPFSGLGMPSAQVALPSPGLCGQGVGVNTSALSNKALFTPFSQFVS